MSLSRLTKALRIVLFVGLAGGVLFFIPFQKIVDAIRGATPYYFWMSCLLGLPISYLGAVQLWMLTRKQGIAVTPFQLFEINLVVRFYSFFSPASTVGSLMRWYKLSGDGKAAEALSAVAVNRIFDVFLSIVFGLFWVLGDANQDILIEPRWILLFLAIVLLLWLVATRYSPPILSWFHALTMKSPSNWVKKMGSFVGRLSASLVVYSRLKVHTIFIMIMIGLTSELVGVLGYYHLALSINAPVPFIDFGWLRSIFFLASLTPFTLVGGIGLREVSIVWMLTSLGVSTELAAVFSFLVYARSVVISLVGGLIELLSLHK